MPAFEQIRVKFYAVLALYCLVEPIVIYIRDGELAPWYYVPMIVHLFMFASLGIYLRNAMFDRLYAFWFCVVNVASIFLARFTG